MSLKNRTAKLETQLQNRAPKRPRRVVLIPSNGDDKAAIAAWEADNGALGEDDMAIFLVPL